MRNRFRQRKSLDRRRAGVEPQRRRGLVVSRGGKMISEKFRRRFAGLGPAIVEEAGDVGVKLPAPALQKRVISGVLDEGV